MNLGRKYSNKIEENLKRQNPHQKDLMSNFNNTRKTKTNQNKIILNYLKQKDVAPWFRGTSYFHMQGADQLLNALRDDAEQSTTHRVKSCLNLIGLEPMIGSKEISFLMRLSRGNDLVFLWFLMEMHYKTPKQPDPNSYSINEQLICSAICHLDMITTLRELDKILPSGHTSRIEMKKAGLQRQQLKELHTKQKNDALTLKYVLPYFNKYPRPQHFGKLLYLTVPSFKVDFGIYSRYNDSNHIVQNESNRWHANYNFNVAKRIVHLIIQEAINNMFHNLKKNILRYQNFKVLCDYHKTLQIMQIYLCHEHNVKRRNECLKSFFKAGKDKEKDVKKINKLLKETVYHNLYKHNEKENESLKVIATDDKIYDVVLENDIKGHCNDNLCKVIGASNFLPNELSPEKSTHGHESLYNIKENVLSHCCYKTKKYINTSNEFTYDNIKDIKNSSEMVFQGKLIHKPFTFNYRKIFLPKHKDSDKKLIRKIFLSALEDNEISPKMNIQLFDLNYGEAIKKFAQRTFDNEVNKYKEKIMDEIEAEALQNQKPLPQYPIFANYNAEDTNLMDRMLFDAFQYLRKNPKFVWAQLPEAHRIPLLREWIAQRFGKKYTPIERAKSYQTSCKIFRALDKNNFECSIPNATQIGKNLFLNYNCRMYLHKKVQHIKDKYYFQLDSNSLEYTRIFWFATRGYICSNGPPRKTFFAYMPSRLRDIQHFRLWKSCEYRNYKVSRNVQRHQKNNK